MSIVYCAECGREIHTNSEAFAESVEGPLCVNCRPEEPVVDDLPIHPRCTKHASHGISTTVVRLGSLRVVEFIPCGCRQGIHDNGKTEKLCPMCKGESRYDLTVRPACSTCKGKWQS